MAAVLAAVALVAVVLAVLIHRDSPPRIVLTDEQMAAVLLDSWPVTIELTDDQELAVWTWSMKDKRLARAVRGSES